MSYGYGGRANPYAQQDSPSSPPQASFGQSPQPSYGQSPQPAYGQSPRPAAGGAPYSPYGNGGGNYGENVEMTPLSQSGAAFGASDPNAILNECRDIGVEIGRVDDNLSQLRMLHDRSLNETDGGSSVTKNQLDELSAATMAMNQDLVMRVRQIKSKPEGQSAKNKPHVDRVERRLRDAMQQYQQVESQFRHKMQDQMERQYRIVRPDATDDEVQAAVEDMSVGGQQVFQQAMMQSGRQGQARAVLDAVKNRHQALLKIEQDMQTITDLFTDLSTLIEQQEPMVEKIDQNGEEAVVDIIKGNEELDVAVETARSTRKKKWICLGICVLIVVIIVVAVVVYYFVTHPSSSSSSSTTTTTKQKRNVVQFAGERPVSTVYAQSKIVEVPGLKWRETERSFAPLAKFSGAVDRKSIAGRYVIPDKAFVESGTNTARTVTLPVPQPGSYDLTD